LIEESPQRKTKIFLGKIGQTIKSGAETLVQETRELGMLSKLRLDVLALENEKSRKLEEIGKLVYDMYQKGQDLPEDLQYLFEAINEIEASIRAKNLEIEKLRSQNQEAGGSNLNDLL